MEWIERLNSALNYMEENLCGEVKLEEAAKIACCGTYHFQRMFAYMAGIPISEYIRRRRMSLAAVELQTGDNKVIDVSLKYGYDSPTAFNRAFKSIHGIAPSQAKEAGVVLKAYPPIHFQMVIKGENELNYHIEKKQAFRIVGLAASLEKEIEKNFLVVPGMWEKVVKEGYVPKLMELCDGTIPGLLGVSSCNDEEDWRYFISVTSHTEVKEPMDELTIPEAMWAIFEGEGTNASIQELERRIVMEWLPTSGYEYANAPDIEVYLRPDPQNAKYEVWIPVIRKVN